MKRAGDLRWALALFAVLALGAWSAAEETPRPDIMLALDNSASMRKNDPHFFMAASVLDFAKALSPGAHLGIVVFDSQSQVALSLTTAGTPNFLDKVQRSLALLNYKGKQTDIPGAIERCLYELREKGRVGAPQSVVLLTDGIVDTGSPSRDERRTAWLRAELAQEAHDRSVRIMSVAFTEGADFELLQALAQSTGGQHFRVLEAGQISNTFQRIAGILSAPAPRPASVVSGAAPASPPPPRGRKGRAQSDALIYWFVSTLVILLGVGAVAWVRARQGRRLPVEATLTDMADPAKTRRLKKQVSYVGRDPGCDIVISHPTVGQRHATIEFDGGAFWLHDLRSRNGTWLNSKRLSNDKELLRGGDIVRFHKYSFMFAAAGGQQTEFGGHFTEVLVFCRNHPDEPALEKCDQCKQIYCGECVLQQGDQLLCTTCRGSDASAHVTAS